LNKHLYWVTAKILAELLLRQGLKYQLKGFRNFQELAYGSNILKILSKTLSFIL